MPSVGCLPSEGLFLAIRWCRRVSEASVCGCRIDLSIFYWKVLFIINFCSFRYIQTWHLGQGEQHTESCPSESIRGFEESSFGLQAASDNLFIQWCFPEVEEMGRHV